MGRKKIKIQPIQDDRNRQVCVCALLCFVSFSLLTPRWSSLQQDKLTSNIGHFSETQVWLDEEGI